MPVSEQHLLIKYNQLLCKNDVNLRIISWKQRPTLIKLNTGVCLGGTEVRLFRTRMNSTNLILLLDKIYELNEKKARDEIIAQYKQKTAKTQSLKYWATLDENIKLERQQHMRSIQKLVDCTSRKYVTPWNKGQTKDTNRILNQISKQRTGKGNPMYGAKMSEEEKQRKSRLIKSRILKGEWTPHIHNSRTHWESVFNNKKYRSSWEAMYASLNPHDEYEQVRIEYSFNNKKHIYIVDFVNHKTKALTEIKPRAHINEDKFKMKQNAAKKWCQKNGYVYNVLTEDYFIDHYNLIPFEKISVPNLRQKIMRIKNEANKQNTNTNTKRNI